MPDTKPTTILALAALLALSACAPGGGTSRDCTFARVIRVQPGDVLTPETARAILTLDRQVEAVCGH